MRWSSIPPTTAIRSSYPPAQQKRVVLRSIRAKNIGRRPTNRTMIGCCRKFPDGIANLIDDETAWLNWKAVRPYLAARWIQISCRQIRNDSACARRSCAAVRQRRHRLTLAVIGGHGPRSLERSSRRCPSNRQDTAQHSGHVSANSFRNQLTW